jgi:hypothetical protein
MFRAAAPNLPYPVEQVQIPWQGIHLEGYIIRPTIRRPAGSGSGSSPTLLMPSGYDSPVEESYLARRRRGGGQGDKGGQGDRGQGDRGTGGPCLQRRHLEGLPRRGRSGILAVPNPRARTVHTPGVRAGNAEVRRRRRRDHLPGVRFPPRGRLRRGNNRRVLPTPAGGEQRFAMYRDADGGGGHCEGMGPSRCYYTDIVGWLQEVWY